MWAFAVSKGARNMLMRCQRCGLLSVRQHDMHIRAPFSCQRGNIDTQPLDHPKPQSNGRERNPSITKAKNEPLKTKITLISHPLHSLYQSLSLFTSSSVESAARESIYLRSEFHLIRFRSL